MCCIFTCFGWMIDLVQRLWTFTMSCCISSAVCCALVTAAMAGIALGYNYSLAEYIDLKETNVSVYLKRGVFDDEIADDMDWRRSGHMPVKGHLKDDNLVTGAPEGPEEMPVNARRRLDDSLLISDDQRKFEGSLMRLTARPPDYKPRGPDASPSLEPVTSDSRMDEIMNKYAVGSLDQMKAIHGLMNMRRSGANQRNTVRTPTPDPVGYDLAARRAMPASVAQYEADPVVNEAFKKMKDVINPARFAVPNENIGIPSNWFLPQNKIPESYKRTMDIPQYDNVPSTTATYPQPIRMSTEIYRPIRPKPHRTTEIDVPKPKNILGDQEASIERARNQLLIEKMDIPGSYKGQFREPPNPKEFKSEDDYEDEANKGLPVRRKRTKRDIKEDKLHSNAPITNDNNKNLNDTKTVFNATRSVFIDNLKLRTNDQLTKEETSKLSSTNPTVVEETSLKVMSSLLSI